MHEAGFIANIFGKVSQEGDNIVLGFAFNRINHVQCLQRRAPGDSLGGLLRFAKRSLYIAGMCLDLEADAEFVLRLPFLAISGGNSAGSCVSSMNSA